MGVKKMTSRRIAKVVFILSTFFFLFSGAPEICQFLPGPEEALAAAPESSWWNLNYGARKKITITAGSAQVPSGYSVSSTLDHASLVTDKHSLSSGNDVRIAYWNGSTWTELDRFRDLDTPWNNASTKIWFKTQAVINASSSNDNYYVYYSYPSATNPPANANNVFLFYDGFESGDTSAWDGVWLGDGGDSLTITAGAAHTGTYGAECYVDDVYQNYAHVVKGIAAQSGINATGWFYLPNEYTDGDYLSFIRVVDDGWAGGASLNIYDDRELYITEYYDGQNWYFSGTILSKGEWHRLEMNFLISETSGRAELWLDNFRVVNESGLNTGTAPITTVLPGNFFMGDSISNTIYFDDSFVRIWVDPEPTTALAGAEGRYEYRKKLTIQYTEVGDSCSSNLSNFPVLVKLSGDWLKTKTNDPTNGRIYNSNGYDICFRGADPETILNYEIEKYDGSAGTLLAWVKIPTVSYSQNTDFYIYYGNPAVTSAPEASVAQGVWSNGYARVFHLNGNANDSTGTQNGNVFGATSTADGKIAGAYSFDGNDWIDTNFGPNYGTGNFTVEAWYYENSFSSGSQ